MKKTMAFFLVIVFVFSGIALVHSDQFDLSSGGSYSGPNWYFGSPGDTTIGYYGYEKGSSTISFKKVIKYWPDETIQNFEATEMSSSDSSTVYVGTTNAYYMTVRKKSGFPRGTVFANYR